MWWRNLCLSLPGAVTAVRHNPWSCSANPSDKSVTLTISSNTTISSEFYQIGFTSFNHLIPLANRNWYFTVKNATKSRVKLPRQTFFLISWTCFPPIQMNLRFNVSRSQAQDPGLYSWSPDPENGDFVRMTSGHFCPDWTRPNLKFWKSVRAAGWPLWRKREASDMEWLVTSFGTRGTRQFNVVRSTE